jgi:hypothetical protein
MSSTEASPGYMGTTLPQKKKKKKKSQKRERKTDLLLYLLFYDGTGV